MAGTPGIMKKGLIDKVFGGRKDFMNTLVMTATGTGNGAGTTLPLGAMCLDSSAGDWFLNTSTAAGGTWVQINS